MTSIVAGPRPTPFQAITISDDATMHRVEWCLRIAAAGCFIGHGAFGIMTKAAWVPYFAVVGIPADLAYVMMPVVGTVDILAGVTVLLSPRPIVLLYMVVWALWTALLRPLSGDTGFETLERAGNYGVPLALLLLAGRPRNAREWLREISRDAGRGGLASVGRVLQWTTASLLFAHGALAAVSGKSIFVAHYASVGLPPIVAPIIGYVEIAAAVAVVVVPTAALLVGVAVWKMATEALFPLAGAPIWEFIERFGSYGAPLALALMFGTAPFTRITFPRSSQ